MLNNKGIGEAYEENIGIWYNKSAKKILRMSQKLCTFQEKAHVYQKPIQPTEIQ